MIGRLSGSILSTRPDEVVVDVHGVGYQLSIPLSTFYRLAEASGVVELHVHTHVREDAIQLFGFWTVEERTTFQRLISISGIGPRIALAVLSGVGVAELDRAIREEDRSALERIPGIGRKTAERMLLELRDRPPAGRRARGLQAASGPDPEGRSSFRTRVEADAASALVHLGYSEDAAERAVAAVREGLGPDAPLEQFLRGALQSLVKSTVAR